MTGTEYLLWAMYWAECIMCITSLIPHDNPMRLKHSYFSHRTGEKTDTWNPWVIWPRSQHHIQLSTPHGFLLYITTFLFSCTSGLPWCFTLEKLGAWFPPEESTGGMWALVVPPGLFLGLWEGYCRKTPRSAWHGRHSVLSSRLYVASDLPKSRLGPCSISEDSIQSATAFKTFGMLEEYSYSKANLPSSTIFILLCHSPDQAQSTLKQFAFQNSPSPLRQSSGQ